MCHLGFSSLCSPSPRCLRVEKKKKKGNSSKFLPLPPPPAHPHPLCLLLGGLEGDSDFLRRGPATLTCLALFITHPHSGVFLFFLFFQPLPPAGFGLASSLFSLFCLRSQDVSATALALFWSSNLSKQIWQQHKVQSD